MNDSRDPFLESLFAEAEQGRPLAAADSVFISQVMASIASRRRNVLIGRFSIIAILFLFEILMSSPLQNSVGMLTAALNTSLVEMGEGWLAIIAEPLNSVAGLVGILLLGLHALYRKVMH